ncbi:MAG: hypothetical protein IT562_14060 [Alphaproteobacteria bacterium]|nr:hypothetical protein [Alphaproteobacteria bacterium]
MLGLAARSLRRLATVLLAFAVAWPFYLGLERQTEDEAARAALDRSLRQGKAEALAAAAIERGELDDADGFVALARRLGRPVTQALRDRLAVVRLAEDEPAARWRRCAAGAFGGQMTDGASVLCTLAADFTLLGDLRDLAIQGSAWAAGRDYDRVIVALSAAGLGATALSAATAGTAAPARAGLSLLKGARRAGHVPPALARAVGTELRLVAEGGDAARLMRATGAVDAVRREHGVLEATRMLRHAGSLDEIGSVAGMYGRFGRFARPVMELTGRTSIHAFKAGYKAMPTVLPAAAMLVGSALVLMLGLALSRRVEGWV